MDCVNDKSLMHRSQEQFPQKLRRRGRGDLLVDHFGIGVQVGVTCLSQHFAEYLSGVAI